MKPEDILELLFKVAIESTTIILGTLFLSFAVYEQYIVFPQVRTLFIFTLLWLFSLLFIIFLKPNKKLYGIFIPLLILLTYVFYSSVQNVYNMLIGLSDDPIRFFKNYFIG